jgi:hypothetical protein
MLGVVAAYLYDAIGDRDSICRIASFYAKWGEPIPFDIALLANLRGRRGKDGRLRVSIPRMVRREPQTNEEARRSDLFAATSEVSEAIVAGGFPWLRQGWDLLQATRLPVHPALIDLARRPTDTLLPFPFTTLTPEAGHLLARLVRLREV